ncbi:MAG: amidoligase family protein [Pseudomonadota bacterium]|nr:amidoligase family protein [Pseudomonadota bacterium]
MKDDQDWLPPVTENHQGEERRVGVELEFAALEPREIIARIQQHFGGEPERHNSFEFTVAGTSLGDFQVELDASYVKAVGAHLEDSGDLDEEFSVEAVAKELLTKAAEQFVPWELVTPPVPVSRLHEIDRLFAGLRDAGAQGTRNSIRYAFGLHLNPELPATDVETILAYFRAYLCLYEWLADQDRIDLTRRITNYIKHFSKDYIQQVVDLRYGPSLSGFMEDYMQANPSRNRSMDLLPMFAHLDEPRVRNRVDDARIKGRPTLHYRLPNCDIDNPQWNLHQPWRNWLQVERLANDRDRLQQFCNEYSRYLKTFDLFGGEWLKISSRLLREA